MNRWTAYAICRDYARNSPTAELRNKKSASVIRKDPISTAAPLSIDPGHGIFGQSHLLR
jgi:hypothetical protein